MDFVSKVREPVVRQNQETIFAAPLVHSSGDVAYETVKSPVPIIDHIPPVMEEHMLDTIQVVEDAAQYAFTEIVHQIVKDLNPTLKNRLAKIEELLVRDTPVLQPSCILGPAQREIRSHILPELFCE